MDESALNRKMLNITAYASQYCEAVENAREMETVSYTHLTLPTNSLV